MPITIAVLLGALDLGMLAMLVIAEAFFLMTKKPHHAALRREWSRALAILLVVTLAHLVTVELVARGGDARSAMRDMAAAVGRGPSLVVMGGWVAVGLLAAGIYGRALLRFADDYAARSGFRIGASLALAGLIGLPLALGASLAAAGVSLLVALTGYVALRELWRRYSREPAWLLRAFVAVSPLGLLALVVATMFLPGGPAANATHGAIAAADALLLLLAAGFFFELARERPDVRSLAARLDDARRARLRSVPRSPPPMEIPRHAGR